ncbi:MAG: RNA 3'-terminal phosphate cyclase [Lentisphaeraceae bacterium]|nr:RNA 3'-terminal phosphate cyclase [Lentisphaeraceae bacterium]
MKDLIKIDGRRGEGGGQVLRTSLALSIITGKPVKISNIRSRRQKPGLLRQHLTAVRAAAEICSAKVEGAEINSTSLQFVPGKLGAGDYCFKIGTAGSTTLVLQTILPPLMLAEGESTVAIEGGTHNMMAPPFDFLEKSFAPVLKRQGVDLQLKLEKWGFYPAGGGRISTTIKAAQKLKSISIEERGELISRKCRSVISALPETVCERELKIVKAKLGWSSEELITEEVERPLGPGNVLMFELEYENITELISSFGDKRTFSEKVASSGVDRVRSYLKSDAPVGEYLADQLLIPMALAGKSSIVCTVMSSHTRTNIGVIEEFLDVKFEVEKLNSGAYRISV